MRNLLSIGRTVYWLAVAYLPWAMWTAPVKFTLWLVGNPNAECANTGVPFMIHVGFISWAAMILLWPLAAWNLGGKQLWLRYRSKNKDSSAG